MKALPSVSCPADGWLTLGAGARAQAYGGRAGGPATRASAVDPRRRPAQRRLPRRRPARRCSPKRSAGRARRPGSRAGRRSRRRRRPDRRARRRRRSWWSTPAPSAGRDRAAAARAADAAVAVALSGRDAGHRRARRRGCRRAPGEDVAHLHVAARGRAVVPARRADAARAPGGRRTSSSSTSRRPCSTLARPAGAATGMDGQPWRCAGRPPTVAALDDLDGLAVAAKRRHRAVLRRRARPGGGPARWRCGAGRGPPGWSRSPVQPSSARRTPRTCVPWWRGPEPAAGAARGQPGARRRRRHCWPPRTRRAGRGAAPASRSCSPSTCSPARRLQIGSVAGYSPLVAGRFAGIGNVAFGVYAAAALLGTALLVGAPAPRRRLPVLLAAGLVAVVVDGAPPWGSDVGGVLALLPALRRARPAAHRRAGCRRRGSPSPALAAAAVVTAFAARRPRPAGRPAHAPRAVRRAGAWTARPATCWPQGRGVLGLLFHSPVTALLPLVVAAAVLAGAAAARRRCADAFAEVPALRAGLLALGVAWLLGFALNDSGAAVPALALAVAVPATASRSWRGRSRERGTAGRRRLEWTSVQRAPDPLRHGEPQWRVRASAAQATCHLFVTGGVASSLGKGLTASSLGRLLKARGLRVTMQKLDPYLNVDPGHDEPVPARRGVRHRRRRRDRPRRRPLRALPRRGPRAAATTSRPARSTRRSSPRSAAGSTSATPSRSSRTSPTRSRPDPGARRAATSTSSSPRSAAPSATSSRCRSWRPPARCARRSAATAASSCTSA